MWQEAPTRFERGQMAVELAVVTPVILLVLVIAIDMLVFAGECARFDHIAAQVVIDEGASPPTGEHDHESRLYAIEGALEIEFARRGSEVAVTCEDTGALLASMVTYRCILGFVPWPLSLASAPSMITHECTLSIDPYTPGELL